MIRLEQELRKKLEVEVIQPREDKRKKELSARKKERTVEYDIIEITKCFLCGSIQSGEELRKILEELQGSKLCSFRKRVKTTIRRLEMLRLLNHACCGIMRAMYLCHVVKLGGKEDQFDDCQVLCRSLRWIKRSEARILKVEK